MAGDGEPLNPNPIVAMAMKIRARKDLETAVDAATSAGQSAPVASAEPAEAGRTDDASAALDALAHALAADAKRLNAILGPDGVTVVRLEKPLRLRVRFRGKRIALDSDAERQLVVVRGLGFDGDYQSDGGAMPALISISGLSTDEGYGAALTSSALLKAIAKDAELPRPAHLDDLGPLNL